jgi:hypothetical protein
MMLMFVGSLLAIVRWHQEPGTRGLAVAAILSALTLVYRPLVMPALMAAFILPAIHQHGWRRALMARATLVYMGVAALPALAWYGYASFIARYFHWKLGSSFMFSLYGRPEFWQEWYALATSELGLVALVLALAGLPFLRSNVARPMVVGLGIGYLCFGLAFTYHIHTHGYYHAQLIPAVALALGPVTVMLIHKALVASERWLRIAPFLAAGLVAMSWITTLRARLGVQVFESAAVAAEIGARVQHSKRVVFLSPFYGLPLQYQGEFTGAYWPRRITYELYRRADERERSVQERLAALGFTPEYFLITHFREYAAHHDDLRAVLERRCAPLAITKAYHLYGRCDLGGALEAPADTRGAGTAPGPS